MPFDTVSLRRPLTSYAKVRTWIGSVIRNRRFQLQKPRVREGTHLDVGCGPNLNPGLINLDYLWRPGVDVCWDIQRGLPFADQSLRGVFSEHCLEHFPLPVARQLLQEIHRVIAPGGTLRLIVPDGELYLLNYARWTAGDTSVKFPYHGGEGYPGPWSPILSVNRIFYQDRESPYGHRTIFDFYLLQLLLQECGFQHVTRSRFRQGRDPQLLVDTADREIESLYVEAWKDPTK